MNEEKVKQVVGILENPETRMILKKIIADHDEVREDLIGTAQTPDIKESAEKLVQRFVGTNIEGLYDLGFATIHGLIRSGAGSNAQNIFILEGLVERMDSNLEEFRDNDPDALHNLAVTCSKLNRPDLELRLLKRGEELWPENIEILADQLQIYYGQQENIEKATKVWERLNELGHSQYFWRYWVFGAILHAKYLRKPDIAQALLLDGITKVPGEDKFQIYRVLPTIFVETNRTPDTEVVEEHLLEGLEMGIKHAHLLAIALAKQEQRKAGVHTDQVRTDHLGKALDWLAVAEAVYKPDQQHPLEEIYKERISVHMGRKDYVEAIHYITAIMKGNVENKKDDTLKQQLMLACNFIGRPQIYDEVMNETKQQPSSTS
ncbi:MAG: hypothetical protein HQL72_05215 [Magnetococcales bacterium]|nr:hypothetical protein [Magnetococcales bacterium]